MFFLLLNYLPTDFAEEPFFLMKLEVFVLTKYVEGKGWEKKSINDYLIFYKGIISFESFPDGLSTSEFVISLKTFLLSQKTNFSLVILSNNAIYAAVDRLSSYPIFYDDMFIYDSSSVPKDINVQDNALLEYLMSGYTLGRKTLNKDISRLTSGELLIREKDKTSITSYYKYYPTAISLDNKQTHLDKLSYLIDTVINRTIDLADGKRLLLPLSGGLDSRILLAKLCEKQYDNLFVFTYGFKESHEAKMAKEVCQKLGVKWNFIPLVPKKIKSSEFKKFVKNYLNFAPIISVSPSLMEAYALYELFHSGKCKPDDFIINGQTGDFVSGGHIRLDFIGEVNIGNIFNYILNKHFSLNSELINKLNNSYIYSKIEMEFLQLQDYLNKKPDLIHFYEYWEWKERQSKLVMGGQRLYDAIGCQWSLPLWDPDFMDFWRDCPVEYKIDQSLYIEYLKQYNYKGVFEVLRHPPEPWSHKYLWVKYIARILGVLGGKNLKNSFYKYMDYYSTYNDQYLILGRALYKQHWRNIRNPGSLLPLFSLNHLGYDTNKLLKKYS